jgi:predicted RNA polymerase sigma factor
VRADLSGEGIRLARMAHRLLPEDGEVTGLLALMLLTDARRPARTGPAGDRAAARDGYLEAARRTPGLPHQRYLHAQAGRLATAPVREGPS